MPATTTRRRRSAIRGRAARRSPALVLQARARRSGGPQDRALYQCGCGHAFKAVVSTSVGCPSCGVTQAW